MLSVNFLNSDPDTSARRKTWILAGVFALAVCALSTAGAAASYRSVQHGSSVVDEFVRLPGINEVRTLVFGNTGPAPIVKPDRHTMNILILGIGGPGHEGSLLTDTIILASVDLKDKKVGMLSIPRDMAWKREDGNYEKINSVHAWLEQDNPGKGAKLTAEKFAEFFGTPIDHVLRIDFRGFADLIDALGGIDINVERGFTDEQYPTLDEKYQTVSFRKGQQHMDGNTALIFARSRHGNNGEGSDFARSHRQQMIMLAVRQRLLSLNTLADPAKMAKLYSAVANHIQTDLSPWDAISFAPLIQDFDPSKLTTHVLTDAEDGELVSTNINNNYLLFAKGGNWEPIKSLAQNPFQTKEELKAASPVLAKIEVRNGTFHTGLAYQISNSLKLKGYDSNNMGNASYRQYKRTLVFDLTNGKKPDDLAKLISSLNADLSMSEVSSTVGPDGKTKRVVYGEALTKENVIDETTDFLVVLGESSYGNQTQP